MSETPVVVVTQAQFANVRKDMDESVWQARIDAAKEFFSAVVSQGFPLFVLVDTETDGQFKDLGARLLYETPGVQTTLGEKRRLLFAAAKEYIIQSGAGNGVVVWSEPEKVDFAKDIHAVAAPIIAGDADIVLPRRMSLTSYPTWQQPWEETGNRMLSKVIGKEFDYFFGPKACNIAATECFMQYPKDATVPDLWDSIFAPLVDAVVQHLRIAEVPVSFTYPKSQRDTEENDILILKKRTVGLDNIVGSCIERVLYWKARGVQI